MHEPISTQTTVSLVMPAPLRDQVRELAAHSERTFSAEVRHALRSHLERQRREAKTSS